jgi:hypothetical protein
MLNATPQPRSLPLPLSRWEKSTYWNQGSLSASRSLRDRRRLETEEQIPYTRISDYELGKNEPSLMTILAYARSAGIHIEDIVDDEREMTKK